MGSISCRSQCSGATITSEALAKNGLNVSHFDPAMFNAISDSGGCYTCIEQCAMSMSKYLVLPWLLGVAHSNHRFTSMQFLIHPTVKRGYKVCWEDKVTVSSFE